MPKVIDIERLFEAAIAAFAEHGYSGATTKEIARRAGVNEVTLFRRYGTKAELITEALTQGLSNTPFAHVTATDDVTADLVALASAYTETTRRFGGAVLTLLAEAARHPELQGALSALLPNLQNAAQIIAAHQDRGRIRPGDPLQQLVVLVGPLMASGLWARTGAAGGAPDLDPRSVARAFLDGHRLP
jgi:AcrR family transcriptional regulator